MKIVYWIWNGRSCRGTQQEGDGQGDDLKRSCAMVYSRKGVGGREGDYCEWLREQCPLFISFMPPVIIWHRTYFSCFPFVLSPNKQVNIKSRNTWIVFWSFTHPQFSKLPLVYLFISCLKDWIHGTQWSSLKWTMDITVSHFHIRITRFAPYSIPHLSAQTDELIS